MGFRKVHLAAVGKVDEGGMARSKIRGSIRAACGGVGMSMTMRRKMRRRGQKKK